MKIKYKKNGTILCMGAMPDLKAGPGEEVKDVNVEIPNESLDLFYFDGEKLVRKSDSDLEKIKSIQSFNVDAMTAHIGEVVTPLEAVELAPYLGALQSYCKAKNFKGAKDFVIALVSLKKATKEQAEKIKDVLLRQGVDLDTFS